MQVDMHFYGTYCIARSAGVPALIACRIAQAAQYVDDSASSTSQVDNHPDGGKFATVVTAHTMASFQNRNEDDQRLVWVPFHFLPGNRGETFSQRLICRKNSEIAQLMMEHHLDYDPDRDFGPELIGIGMHVYADTFAHYGFSGTSSRVNRVVSSSIKLKQSDAAVTAFLGKTFGDWMSKWGGLVQNFREISSEIAEKATGGLGHSGVSLYPDSPFLEWEYEYEFPEIAGTSKVYRDNHTDYMEAAENMWYYLQSYVNDNDFNEGSDTVFEDFAGTFSDIYRLEGGEGERIALWEEVALSGDLGFSEEIPPYVATVIDQQHKEFSKLDRSADVVHTTAYRFHQAATVHRDYVVKELLPSYGIIVW